jgi:DNA-binding transcriptional LysR family regulator
MAPPMNVHHLELFYYVARHGGISAAVRHIPYGIQQPAVSGQMRQLEEGVGAKLFERSPFRLTAAGERLFAHLRPFFEGLDDVTLQLREAAEPELRFGGSEFVLREHIPVVLQRIKARFPRLRFSLRTGVQTQLEEWLREGTIELAATLVEARPSVGLRRLPLARLPLVLVVPRRSRLKSAEELWAQRKIAEPLICLPPDTILARAFQRELKRRGLVWRQTVEAGSIELLTRYVANGDGLGVNIGLPSVVKHRDVRVLPLPGFAPLTMGLLWRGEPSLLLQAVIEEVQRYSRETWPDLALTDKLP